MSDVVVAVTAQRLPERGLVVVVRTIAPKRPPVRALAALIAWRVTAPACSNRMDGAEARRREGHENLRVLNHRRGYIVMSAT